jgi:hypothetical protein
MLSSGYELPEDKRPRAAAHIGISLEVDPPRKEPLRIRLFSRPDKPRFPTKVSDEATLHSEYIALTQALEPFLECFKDDCSQPRAGLTTQKLNQLYGELLTAGNGTYNRVFDREARQFLRAAINDIEKRGIKPILEIECDVPSFPWELLVDIDPITLSNDYSPENLKKAFWGTKYNIHRLISLPGLTSYSTSNMDGGVCGILADKSVTLVRDEIDFLNHMYTSISIFPDQTTGFYPQTIRQVKSFMNGSVVQLHFAGHATSNHKNPLGSTFSLTQDISIKLGDLDAGNEELILLQSPLIVMNACRTAVVADGRPYGFVTTFMERGAKGLVATQTRIPSTVAFEFTSSFYKAFVQDKVSLGDALAAFRDHLISFGNPLALTYALHADPFIEVQ